MMSLIFLCISSFFSISPRQTLASASYAKQLVPARFDYDRDYAVSNKDHIISKVYFYWTDWDHDTNNEDIPDTATLTIDGESYDLPVESTDDPDIYYIDCQGGETQLGVGQSYDFTVHGLWYGRDYSLPFNTDDLISKSKFLFALGWGGDGTAINRFDFSWSAWSGVDTSTTPATAILASDDNQSIVGQYDVTVDRDSNGMISGAHIENYDGFPKMPAYHFIVIDSNGGAHRVIFYNHEYDSYDHTLPNVWIQNYAHSNWWVSSRPIDIIPEDYDSGVKSVTLPDGSVDTFNGNLREAPYNIDWSILSNGSGYGQSHFNITENGDYTFHVTDYNGNVYTQTIHEDHIDYTSPTVQLSESKPVNGSATITVTMADSQSGLGSVSMAGGSYEWLDGQASLVRTYTVTKNGTYTFSVGDSLIGTSNQTTKSITVSDLDTAPPSLSVTGNPASWTNQNTVLTATATDSGSGVKRVQTPDGVWHTGSSATYSASINGDYKFIAEDNAGNQATQTVTVTKIDKLLPTLSVFGNPSSLVHKAATLSFISSDADSGVKTVQKQNADSSWSDIPGLTYTVSQNGTYVFRNVDNAGNVSAPQTVNVINIGDLLYFDAPMSQTISSTLSGKQKQTTLTGSVIHLEDNRDTSTGWHLTAQATAFNDGAGHALPAGSLQVKAPQITGADNAPVSAISGYQSLDAGSALTVVSAASGKGHGAYDVKLNAADQFQATVPAKAYKGTYVTQVTWSLVSAP